MLDLPILNVRLNACAEDWQQMTPTEQGRHCAQCNRTVIDFTARTQVDLETAFQTSVDGRVCGRFRQSQLAPKPQLRRKLRRFLVALVLVCGLGLTSGEAWAQVRKVVRTANCANPTELILKTPKEMNPMVLANPMLTQGFPSPMPLSESNANSVAQQSDLLVGEIADPKVPLVYTVTEQMPIYKFGGLNALPIFVSKNIRWPKAAARIQGRVFVNFIIDKAGRVHNVHIIKGVHPLIDAESVRVIRLLDGKFTPGQHNNQPVDVSFTLPITFKLD